MTLTLLALLLIPLYLKMVLDPKVYYKFAKAAAKDEFASVMLSIWMLTLSAIVLSTTGLNFSWAWESLLAWLGLLIGIKGVFFMIPDLLKRSLKWFNEDSLPVFGFIGLVFALALIYIDTQMLG